jgi:hypothetical protein
MASRPPWAANLFAAVRNGWPVSPAISAAIASPKPGGAFRPVPTAVPPAASSYRPAADAVTRSLSDRQRYGVFEVGAADLDYVPPLAGLGLDRLL